MVDIIGRYEEQKILESIYRSDTAEFVAIYGRRRVGKTYLVKYFFETRDCIFFHITGQKDALMHEQIEMFTRCVESMFFQKGVRLKEPDNWGHAFELLTGQIKEKGEGKTVVLFFDELPWLSSKKSKFMQNLDYYWNLYWAHMANVKLIVAGSAASWMIDNLINEKAGLHNRITKTILLRPFTLLEAKAYLRSRGIYYTDKQVLELYMVMGGVPYYLRACEKQLSVPQNIDRLYFDSKGLLYSEFKKLFASLFNESTLYEEITLLLSKTRRGTTGSDLAKQTKHITAGGRLYKRLEELEAGGFVLGFIPYGFQKKNHIYRIIDEYVLFYLKWVKPIVNKLRKMDWGGGYWSEKVHSAAWKIWMGYAFENICYKHLPVVRKKLNISSTALADSWQYIPKKGSTEKGAQIDLLFDRDDDVITICEIKYRSGEYRFDKEEAHKLLQKVDVFKKRTKTKKQIQLVLITNMPLKETMYSEELIMGNVSMYDFFNAENYA